MKQWWWIILAILLTGPGLVVKFGFPDLQPSAPLLTAFLLGLGVLGAAFLLAWATEAAQHDIPQALALSVMALIAILPEYAVDYALTYEAGSNPAYKEYAIANMIGANRMIVGFAWPLLVFIFALKFRHRYIKLGKEHRVEVGFLLIAGLYSLMLPLKGQIDFFDVVFLVGLFAFYSFRLIKGEVHEPELIGPARLLGELPRPQRIASVLALMGYAGFVILMVAKPFAQSLIATGTAIGVDEVFLIKWFAPLASEAPEIVICVLFTLRAMAAEGLGTLVASKVNQWTLLVGTLPLVFSLGSKAWVALPLQGTFEKNGVTATFDLVGPMLVTSAQTLLAVMIVLALRVSLWDAAILFGLLVAQFFFPAQVGGIDTDYLFAGVYLGLAFIMAVRKREHFVPTFKSMLSPRYVREQTSKEEAHPVENIGTPVRVAEPTAGH